MSTPVPIFVIEVEHPHHADDSQDARFVCEGTKSAADRWDDVTGLGHNVCAEAVAMVADRNISWVGWTHPETGVETTMRLQ